MPSQISAAVITVRHSRVAYSCSGSLRTLLVPRNASVQKAQIGLGVWIVMSAVYMCQRPSTHFTKGSTAS